MGSPLQKQWKASEAVVLTSIKFGNETRAETEQTDWRAMAEEVEWLHSTSWKMEAQSKEGAGPCVISRDEACIVLGRTWTWCQKTWVQAPSSGSYEISSVDWVKVTLVSLILLLEHREKLPTSQGLLLD